MAMIDRLSNTSYMGFQYSVDNVVGHLITTGITTIPGERRSVEELEGMSWNLKPSEQTSVCIPSRVAVNERINRSLSLPFERYLQVPQPAKYSIDQHDREILGNDHLDEDEEHFIRIYLQAPQIKHIHYDICLCEDCLNETRILEEEPLNKAKRSNKPKRSRQRMMMNEAEERFFSYKNNFHRTSKTFLMNTYHNGMTNLLFKRKEIRNGMGKPIRSKACAGVLLAIKFTHTFVSEMCKDATLAKELRDLSLCSTILIPGYYKNNRKKYGIRKSRTYKGKPHNSHVKPFKKKYKDDRGRVKKSFMTIEGINESNDEQSVEEDYDDQNSHHAFSNEVKLLKELLKEKMEQVQQMIKDQAKVYYENRAIMQRKEELWQSEKSLLVKDLTDALKNIDQLKIEQIMLGEQNDEEIKKLKTQLQKEKEKETKARYSSEEFPPLGNSQIERPFMEAEVHYSRNTTIAPKLGKSLINSTI
nr:hypothetical protein LSAT_5X175041 [Tanacetum cinerariifolium]